MLCSTDYHPSPSTSTQKMASTFSHPSSVLAATPEPSNNSVLWPPRRHNKSLHPLPEEETQQDEIFNVWTVNYRNLDHDARVAIKYPDPERSVVYIGELEMAKEEHAIVEGPIELVKEDHAICDFQSPYLACSSAASSTTPSSTTGPPSYECLSPLSSYLGHTQWQDQFYTHTASQSASSELIPSSLAPYGTMEPSPRMAALDEGIARHSPPPATTIKPANSTRTSTPHHKPKPKPISRPLIDIELAGYKPVSGPSPLLADQAAARHVYRAVKRHISDQLESHTERDRTRAAERQQAARTCLELAAMNAEAAQDFRAAERALGIAPGTGARGLVRKPVYDDSAWRASTSPNGHVRPSPLPTAEAVQGHKGRRPCASSSIESVCGSSARSYVPQVPQLVVVQSRRPVSPPGSGRPSGRSSRSDSSRLGRYYARPRYSKVALSILSS